jgi:hypothetical protein
MDKTFDWLSAPPIELAARAYEGNVVTEGFSIALKRKSLRKANASPPSNSRVAYSRSSVAEEYES